MERTINAEFDRQLQQLLTLGYPKLANMSADDFTAAVEPLRAIAQAPIGTSLDATPSWAPFVIVVSSELIRGADLVPLTTLAAGTKPGVVDRNHGELGLAPYRPLPELKIPDGPAYILFDIQRGEEFCNVRPVDALPVIKRANRTPLTIHEGIALVTQFPEMLEKNRCFMLAGSRRGDRRVPALWISDKAPKLGWCWEGNPHTWLGMASAGSRANS